MLETVDFSRPDLGKEEYKRQHDALVDKLVVLQQQARSRGAGLVVLFEGWNGAGKGSRISDLMFNLDARATSVHVTGDVDFSAAREFAKRNGNDLGGYYPFMEEFWAALGERSAITFFDRGWYSAAAQRVLISAFDGLDVPKQYVKKHGSDLLSVNDARARRARACGRACLDSIRDFERQLSSDGYCVVKFFVHVSEEGQRKRLERLRDDPALSWRVSEERFERIGNYQPAYSVYDLMLEKSNFDFSPWCVVDGENKREANILIASTLVRALERAIAQHDHAQADASRAGYVPASGADKAEYARVAAIQASLAPTTSRFPQSPETPALGVPGKFPVLPAEEYKPRLKELQRKLFRLESRMYRQRIPLIVMYEGWDAAGKGGNIKRVAQALDARAYTIFPSPAPTALELAHPHLWRYWTRLPKAGHVGLYDRSWYGRVLVERVEGFATADEWSRAYDEINAFERDLTDWGAILLKFWVDVSPEVQLARFNARAADPAKQWKITDEDWRNREKHPLYKAAIEDMFRLTSTAFAPWTVLESDDKRYARVKALETIVAALEDAGLSD